MPRHKLPPGKGRPKGSKNAITLMRRDIAEQFLECVDKVGGVQAVFNSVWQSPRTRHMIADTLFKQFIPKKVDVEVVQPIEVVIVDHIDSAKKEN